MARTITVEVDQIGPSTSKGAARSHSVVIDRPAEKGGEDKGPLGGELLLLSLGGCFMSTLLAAIKTREANVSGVKISVAGTIGGVPERFESLDFEEFFLQPMDAGDAEQTERNVRAALEYCLAHPRWRLSLQTHKLLDIR